MTRPLSNTVATRITLVAIACAFAVAVRRRVVRARTELAERAKAREVASHGA